MNCCINKLVCGAVMDYIGVPLEDEVQEYEQALLPGFIDYVWEDKA